MKNLYWHKLKLVFKNRINEENSYTTFQSIFKTVYMQSFPEFQWEAEGGARFLFHLPERKYSQKVKKGDLIKIELIFCKHSTEEVETFLSNLKSHLSVDYNARFYSLHEANSPELRFIEDLKKDYKGQREICLEFMTPYSFKQQKGKHRDYIDKETFIKHLESRFTRLFGEDIKYFSEKDDFEIITYWNYTQIDKRQSTSGSDHVIGGFVGKLYIKGQFQDLWPFLLMGQELHLSTKIAYGYGYYKLRENSLGYFSEFFPNRQSMMGVLEEILEEYDSPLDYKDDNISFPFDQEEFVDGVYESLKNGTYEFSPSKAFSIKKEDKSQRIVEQLCFRDNFVNKYILKNLSKVLDKFFEEESIGFRKGVSREKALELFKENVTSGYEYVIESDIEDFFPNILHQKLFELLDFYLPEKDKVFKSLIESSIKSSYVYNGEIIERKEGLSQGNPLSPLLANLYLDSFDEFIKEIDEKIIRFADDFIIMTRTYKDALLALDYADEYLDELGLDLKEEKTRIVNIEDGFSFLGMNFHPSSLEPEEIVINPYKKPLYITDEFIYIALNGDSINIYRNGKIQNTIPIRRISEIILMNKSIISTSLLKRLNDFEIPVTITQATGYYTATVKPDNKKYYEISYKHNLQYNSLSKLEVFAIAREFALSKLMRYKKMLESNYSKENYKLILQYDEALLEINQVSSIEGVRGKEGIMAKRTFAGLNNLIHNKDFHIKKRVREEADLINSALNFGYYLLFTRINTLLRAEGFNPYLGYLHSSQNNYESLVCDFQELFRAEIDLIIIKMINRGIITKDSFVHGKNGHYLTKNGKSAFLQFYEKEFHKKASKNKVSIFEEITLQIYNFKRWVLYKEDLKIGLWRYL